MANRILIVDDAAFMRMMIRDILSKNGYEVCGEANDGAQAIEKYKELRPDLITMDITMPEMDGIQALKEIKKNRCQRQGHHVFRDGAAGDGYRCDSSRRQGLYREAVSSGSRYRSH